MKDLWLKILYAFWMSQAYLAQNIGDEKAVETAKYQAQKIEWKLKWRLS